MDHLKKLNCRTARSFMLAVLFISAQIFFGHVPRAHAGDEVIAWGDMTYDLPVDSNRPRDSVVQIAAGTFHSLALQRDGTITVWGDDRFGQLEIPDRLNQKRAVAIAAGNVHSLALLRDGTVAAWGPMPGEPDYFGQTTVPPNLKNVAAIAAGAIHSLALKRDGTVVAWGANTKGQCDVPRGLNRVAAISGGTYHSVALKDNGTVVAWGNDSQ